MFNINFYLSHTCQTQTISSMKLWSLRVYSRAAIELYWTLIRHSYTQPTKKKRKSLYLLLSKYLPAPIIYYTII